MVKLNWLEEFAIYIIVAVIMIFFVRFMQTLIIYDNAWVWIIIWLILYLGISNIIIKAIRGRDIERENKDFEKWWKKQKTWEKVIIILGSIVVLMMIWGLIFGV